MRTASKEIINFNDNLYIVQHRFKEDDVITEKIDDLKIYLSCDVVLRKDGVLHFCVKIEDAIIE